MAEVLLNIGSNISRSFHLQAGVEALSKHFSSMQCSQVFESLAEGFDGDNFYNMAVLFETQMPCEALAALLKEIEFAYGRQKNAKKFSARTLDIDLLSYGNVVEVVEYDGGVIELPRADIVRYAHVLAPLAQLVPDMRHPVLAQSYADLWLSFSQAQKDRIWCVDVSIDVDAA